MNRYSVVLRTKTLPMSLITDSTKVERMNLLTAESFSHTFGPDKQRKRYVFLLFSFTNRVKLASSDLLDLVDHVSKKQKQHEEKNAYKPTLNEEEKNVTSIKDIFLKAGQSKRIYNELYKVLDSSDVIIQVLDARDPMGTRSKQVEEHLKKNMRHKHLIFLLNKCDLVPTWCTKKWVALLSEEYVFSYSLSFIHSFTHSGNLTHSLVDTPLWHITHLSNTVLVRQLYSTYSDNLLFFTKTRSKSPSVSSATPMSAKAVSSTPSRRRKSARSLRFPAKPKSGNTSLYYEIST